MMCNAITAPANSCSPDANRTGPDAPARLPEWVVHLIALVVRFILERAVAARSPRVRLPSWWHYRPDLPPGSVQQLAASRRGAFGNAIAWMCRRRGIGPGHPNWPELSRAIVAFGGSVKGFRPGLPACGLQWWEHPESCRGCAASPRRLRPPQPWRCCCRGRLLPARHRPHRRLCLRWHTMPCCLLPGCLIGGRLTTGRCTVPARRPGRPLSSKPNSFA